MRTALSWILLASAAALTVCATAYAQPDDPDQDQQPGAVAQPGAGNAAAGRCRDRTANIINTPNQPLTVRPDSVTVCRGFTVTLIFRNAVAPGRARTRPDGAAAPWLDVANGTARAIVIEVPTATTPMDYKYTLEIQGFDPLDPRIIVQ